MAKKKREVDDRFKKFGTVSFTSISKINDFVDYLEKGQVVGTKCKDCGLIFFPARADCYQCLSSNMDWFEVSGNCRHQRCAQRDGSDNPRRFVP